MPSENWLRLLDPLARRSSLIHLLSNYLFGLYGQMWRYASVQEARRVLLAGLCSFVAVLGLDVLIGRGGTARSRSPSVVFGSALAMMVFGAIRFQSRLFGFRRRRSTRPSGPGCC